MLATAARRSTVALREATFDDYPRIVQLEASGGLKTRGLLSWLHFWRNNTAWQRRPDWPIGWVLETAAGETVGSVCNIPLEYELDGKRLIAAAGRAWVVSPAYRSYSLLLLDEFFRQKHVDLFLNTTVNEHAAAAFQTFGTERVPAGRWDRSGYWITGYRGFARSALRNKGWSTASALTSIPLGVALFLKDRLRGTSVAADVAADRDLDLRVATQFDDRFDTFWQELRMRRRHELLGVRTRDALEWHFHRAIRKNRLRILTLEKQGRLLAYSIFLRKDNEEYGLKRVRLVDFQSLDDAPQFSVHMLQRELELCRSEGAHLLEDVGCRLQGVDAPNQRRLPSWMYYYKVNDPALAAKLKSARAWRPFLFDGDASL